MEGSNRKLNLPHLAAALIAGATLALTLPTYPAAHWLVAFGVLALGVALRLRSLLPIAAFAGALLTLHAAFASVAARIEPAMVGSSQSLTATILEPPKSDALLTRIRVKSQLGNLRLSWYGAPPLAVGERWQLQVKLKRPRGTFNPGAFDFEQLALRERVVATGYVQHGKRLQAAGAPALLAGWRTTLSERIGRTLGLSEPTALIQALALGDQRAMSQAQWDILRASGTTHLFAISGFHIGLIALLVLFALRAVARFLPPSSQRFALYPLFKLLAVLAAVAYGLLVGFAVPTARTCLVMLLFAAMLIARRTIDVASALLLVGAMIVLADPLTLLAPGFWLSFLSVGGLLYAFGGRARRPLLVELVHAQWASSVFLLPLTLKFFGQFSPASIPANFLAIPLISLVIVPFALLGTAAEACAEGAGRVLLMISMVLMQLLMVALAQLGSWCQSITLYVMELSDWRLAIALLSALIALAPRALRGRYLGLIGLLVLLPIQPPLPHGAWRMTVFDVGLGQAVLIETAKAQVLIDTGPAYGPEADAGDRVVVPGLRMRQVRDIDRLIVSHGDQDHAGGLKSVLAAYPEAQVISSDPKIRKAPCLAGQRFSYDGVDFEFLHPTPGLPYLKNLSSCVLRVSGPGGSALIPGDIDSTIEGRLLRDQRRALNADVLLVPHHGSASSSTQAWIDAVSPEFALVSAGFKNRFDFPRSEVVARYRGAEVAFLNTADSGQIEVLAIPTQALQIKRTRLKSPSLWRE